jgi:ABC-type nitrate/sulfonate/bicarbonate transport system substrate-binding protein
MRLLSKLLCLVLLMPFSVLAQSPGGAKPLTPVSIITFGGGFNLPAWAAERQGFFAKHGVAVKLTITPNSTFLMTNLIDGKFDIGIFGIDNLVAYQEGAGEGKTTAKPDLVTFMGLNGGFLHLIATPEVKTIAGLRGKSIAVDALTTGYAFVLRDMLARAGLKDADVTYAPTGGSLARFRSVIDGKHAATLLNTPFDLQAVDRGMNRLGSAGQLMGSYQGHAAAAQRGWLAQNEAAAIGVMRGYREAMEWIYDPKNREIAEALLVANDREMTPALARRTLEVFTDPKEGLFRDVAISMDGMRTVLDLRNRFGQPATKLTDPQKYVDLELHRKAFPPKL